MAEAGSSSSPTNSKYFVGVLVVSDSCSADLAIDTSGVNLKEIINKEKTFSCDVYSIIPDNIESIKEKLTEWSDSLGLNLILTTGGTGFSPRDVTPEATKAVIDRETTSLTNAILIESLKITQFAMLSRAISGIRNKTLILNLPGSKKGSQECLEIVLPILKHALDLINDVKNVVKRDHTKIQHRTSISIINEADKTQSNYENHHHHSHHHHNNNHTCNHGNKEMKSTITAQDVINRPRKSSYPMIPVEEAIKIILDQSDNLETEEIYYLDALNRVSASSIVAEEPLPPFAASVKDGFAFKLTDEQKSFLNKETEQKVPFVFEVIGSSNAGDDINIDLKEGQCVKINTGAPVPLKSDGVIQIEDTISIEKNTNGQDTKIEIVGTSGCGGSDHAENIKIDLKIGQDIRPIGFDINIGETVVRERMVLKAPQIGICATVGALKLNVFKLPSISLVSTGNELCKPDESKLNSGKIRDSNKPLLFSALKSIGIANIFDAGIANDDVNSVLEVFKKAIENSDVVISTGGVSMGDRDLVKDVLEKDLNCKIHFARMNMKPGKPTTFATCEYNGRKKLLFCLPGNPVSAIVTFNLVVVPCLKKLMGYSNPFFSEIKVKCEFDSHLDPRPEYHRCYLKWPKISSENSNQDYNFPSAYSTGNQHSSRLLSMNEANCLVILPGKTKEKSMVHKGEIMSALLIETC